MLTKLKGVGLRVGAVAAVCASSFIVVPQAAVADEQTTPSAAFDGEESGLQPAESQWLTTDEDNAVTSVPSAPGTEAEDAAGEASDSSEVPAPPSVGELPGANGELEVDGDVSFDFVEKRDDSYLYELKATVKLPTDALGLAEKPAELSFLRTPGDNPANGVEKVELDSETVDDDAVSLFAYPQEADAELPSNFPDDVTGDLLSVDLKDYDADESVDVTAQMRLANKADHDDKWSLYTGDASAQELNAAVRAVNGHSGFRAARANDRNKTRLVVQVGGDRIMNGRGNNASRTDDRSDTVYKFTGHRGAELALYAPLHNGKFGSKEANDEFKADENPRPINQPWARCTSDIRGECVFEVPKSGKDTHPYYWVAMTKAAPGFEILTSLRAGGSGSTTTKGQEYRYAFATPYMKQGETFYSGVHYKRGTIGDREFGSDWQAVGDTSSFMAEFGTSWDSLGRNLDRSSLGVFQQVRKNPPLSNRCGLNVGFIVDTSGSMGTEGIRTINTILKGGRVDGRQVEGVIPALAQTKTKMGFVSFDNTSPGSKGWFGQHYNIVQPKDISQQNQRNDAFKWVDGLDSGGATNWEAALRQYVEYNQNARERYDVVFMITDGNPTQLETANKRQEGSYGEFRHAEAATAMANTLKNQGTRVVPVGIPSRWPFHFNAGNQQLELSDSNLAAISGYKAGGDSDSLRKNDFFKFQNANLFRQALINTMNTCEISVERRLYTGDDPNAVPTPDNTDPTKNESKDWAFEGHLTPSQGRPSKQTKKPEERPESDNRVANFELNGSTDYKQIDIREQKGKTPSNWSRMPAEGGKNAQCFDERGNNVAVENLDSQSGHNQTNDFRLTNVPAQGGIHCVVYYRVQPQFGLTVHKVDTGDPEQPIEGAEFKLERIDDDNKASEVDGPRVDKSQFTWENLSLGRYQLTETKAPKGGYEKLDEPILFGVSTGSDGKLEFYRYADKNDKEGKLIIEEPEFPITHVETKNKAVDISIANSSSGESPELPDAGGSGIVLLVLSGVGLMLFGVGMSLRNSRRKNGTI